MSRVDCEICGDLICKYEKLDFYACGGFYILLGGRVRKFCHNCCSKVAREFVNRFA